MVLSLIRTQITVLALCMVGGGAYAQSMPFVDTTRALALRAPTMSTRRVSAPSLSEGGLRLSLAPMFSLYMNAGIGPWLVAGQPAGFSQECGSCVVAPANTFGDATSWLGIGVSFRLANGVFGHIGAVAERDLLGAGFTAIAPVIGLSFSF